ncbi:MAG: hypothetical protein HY699_01370 [Deltaproteobacteria bacterium]|nr:hypothetical protein [Deltaproteobacteria bacterium]
MLGGLGLPPAGALVIDDFRSGVATAPGLTQRAVGKRVAGDSALAGVLGGGRRLGVAAARLRIAAHDAVSSGVVPEAGRLNYASTEGADGRVELNYDANGRGLNTNWRAERGLAVEVADADAAAVPYTVTLVLADGEGRSTSATQTVTRAGPHRIEFRLSNLRSLDLGRIRSLTIVVDPGEAGDLQLKGIQTLAGGATSP